MLFKAPYKIYPESNDSHVYSAVLNVQLALPYKNSPRTKKFEVVIDSGASRTLFNSELATFVGLDLKSGPVELTIGIGGAEETYLHDVHLYLPGGLVKIKAGFKEKLPVAGLLGMYGFFEFFKVTFDHDSQQCLLDRIYRDKVSN